MNERFDLTGRTVIITGGGKGIGKVYAQEFAKAGARVVAADIDGAAAKSVAEALAAEGLEAIGLATDIASKDSANAMAQGALVARNPGRGMGSRHGGQPARHVFVLPRGVPGDEGAAARQDRQHLLVAG